MKIALCKKECKSIYYTFKVGCNYNYEIIEVEVSLFNDKSYKLVNLYIPPMLFGTDYLQLAFELFPDYFYTQEEIRKNKLDAIYKSTI